MKTVVHNRFGSPDVLEVQDVPKPVPRDGEVLIKVHATTVTTADGKMRRGEPLWGRVVIGLLRPRRRLRTPGLELAGEVESIGADHVIDYSDHDFTKNANTYDVVFDAVGRSTFRRCRASLKDDGQYLSTDGLTNVLWSLRGGKRVVVGMSVDKGEALDLVRELVEAGTLRVLVDRTFPLDEAAEAHEYVDRGHKKGNVVLLVAHPTDDHGG